MCSKIILNNHPFPPITQIQIDSTTVVNDTAVEVAKKTIVSGTIGRLTVAATGGNTDAIKKGRLDAGSKIRTQDGYQQISGQPIDGKTSARVAIRSVWVVASLLLANPVSVSRALADYVDTCAYTLGASEEAIAACTHAINSGRWRGSGLRWAYVDRGNRYFDKGDLDRAMADYNEAIRLDPNAHAFNGRGNTYRAKGDLDRAMADYNEAIRLDPKFAYAFNGRGNTYSAKGDLDRAMADYNEAIRLDPKYAHAFNGRGNTYSAKGDLDRAMADYNEAIRLDPKYGRGYLNRGIAYLYSGNLVKALADESQANAVRPKDAYAALWLDIIGQRNNVPSNLSQAISQIDMTAWPAPVLRMFLGQLTRAAVLAAANDPDANKKTGQVCEANFYSGELALRAGGKDEATRLFQLASSGCPKDFREYYAANAELKALGVTP